MLRTCSVRRRCTGRHSHAGWNGVVFVRDGFYASGVFRFSVQFTAEHDSLAMPTVHFPALLLHPQMEVRGAAPETCILTRAAGEWACVPCRVSGAAER